ncbi:tyrosine-type recombinase/integrase [Paraburkholderia sp. A2WS-5]|uniref:tyrosine-type recombinase/integrase n=1 Tax=unclassified Paraburkholderia TaxID=2615204 RepID=UPI003B7DBAD2
MGEIVGENRSQTISEGALLKLGAADHDRTLTDGTGLSGKVHAGAKRIAVHFRYRYRFQGASREMPLGAWPRDRLADIRLRLEETKLRVAHGGDPAGERRLVRDKLKVEQAQVEVARQELAELERELAESQLTLKDMFEAWHPEAMAQNTPQRARAVRRMFELHLLPQSGATRVLDVKPEDIRKAVRALIAAQKVSTAISLHVNSSAMYTWAGRRRPWRLLFEVNPVEDVDLGRMLPDGYQDWCDRVLTDDEIMDLRGRFAMIRNAFEFRTGRRRGLATPLPREHELAVWLMLSTLARINEVCAARWREHIDLKKATWFVPPEQAKNSRGFTIHLSPFALRLLRELHELTGHTPYVLPHTRDNTKPVTTAVIQCAIGMRQCTGKWESKARRTAEITASSLVLAGGPWSCHDLRRTGATIMQACGFEDIVIERCLNHSVTTHARHKGLNPRLVRTYQQYDYEAEMHRAWDALGEYLQNLDGALSQIDGPQTTTVANDPQRIRAA